MAFPSTFLDLQDEVLAELRLEPGDRPKVQDWINRAYARGALETEAVQTFGTAAMTAGTSTYLMPSPVARIKVLKVKAAGAGGNYGPPLQPLSLEQIADREGGLYSTPTTGPTQFYALIGEDEIEVWPAPSGADLMFFWYAKLPAPLALPGDVLELQEPYGTDICKYGACMEARPLVIGAPDVDYRGLYDDAVRRYRTHLRRRRGVSVEQFALPGGVAVPTRNDADRGY